MARSKCLLMLTAAAMTTALLGSAAAQADELSAAKQKAAGLTQKQQETKQKITKLASKEQAIQEQLASLQDQLVSLNHSIASLQQDLAQRNEQIQELQTKIAKTKAELEEQYQQLKERVQVMYETDHTSYLTVLFQSTSFSELVTRLQLLSGIAEQNQQMMAQIQQQKEELDAQQEDLQAQQRAQQKVYQALQEKQQEQKAKQAQEQKLLEQVHASRVAAEKDLADEQSALATITAAIEKMQQEQKQKAEAEAKARAEAEQRARQEAASRSSTPVTAPSKSAAAANGPSASSGSSAGTGASAGASAPSTGSAPSASGWVWPVPSCHSISSSYGYRILNGKPDFHPGIDIPGAYGAPIVAATSGTVVYAGPASGYGNWVVIESAKGLYEIYGHMAGSSILVSPGQTVHAGQQIASIGNEGESTGPHLHFEVSTNLTGSNGLPVPTNPLNYVHP
ncbi:murein hydrolase activator EnvC family protein [Alicyclobacillus herbarius]|uniref:murein hydrolase activator EnvC family protein n=1 Tax=Alicyclobacillus herbarius TaxID=122960 RepID=UPI00040DC864|nr:peptidoglycan DD-metalloendopeptidase family protein [Alicyclobacillus herbarius]